MNTIKWGKLMFQLGWITARALPKVELDTYMKTLETFEKPKKRSIQ